MLILLEGNRTQCIPSVNNTWYTSSVYNTNPLQQTKFYIWYIFCICYNRRCYPIVVELQDYLKLICNLGGSIHIQKNMLHTLFPDIITVPFIPHPLPLDPKVGIEICNATSLSEQENEKLALRYQCSFHKLDRSTIAY